jgi:Icc protein
VNASLKVNNADKVRLVQITDTHLFEADDGCLLSVNTAESFRAVVHSVVHQGVSFDAILATGDISQDHSKASYQRFAQGIAHIDAPCFWLPGNHDFKPSMSAILPQDSAQIRHVDHQLLGQHWQLIMLDSQVVGVPHGRLSEVQLALLQEKLSHYPERHTMVLLHHHPLLVGSAWLDQHALKDSDEFWRIVTQASNVKAIVCGHVHQDMNREHHGVQVIATPSTCVQFKPNCNDFALDRLSPGWREFELHSNGTLVTCVKRLVNGLFQPDFTANGY